MITIEGQTWPRGISPECYSALTIPMQTIIISDIHLGSHFCMCDRLTRFLAALPEDATLVLNGDSVDRWHPRLPPAHMALVDSIRRESQRRRVVWLQGNHDMRCPIKDPARIEFQPSLSVGKRLYVAHGHEFDSITYHKVALWLFRLLYRLRDRFASDSVHVAFYAKKFHILYGLLQKHVMMNAVAYAKQHGYQAVTCGHTHGVKDVMVDGVRYINTGSWTEKPVVYLSVDDSKISLLEPKP